MEDVRAGSATLIAGFLLLQIMQGQGTWLVGTLNLPPLRGLGRISYGSLSGAHHFISPVLCGRWRRRR